LFSAIDLPCEIDPDRAKATLSRGTLEIILPKAQPVEAGVSLLKAA
jgi:HSP20 family molecular chaperone IbpA